MNNRIKKTDSKFKCNIFLFLSVTVFIARLSIRQRSVLVNVRHSHYWIIRKTLSVLRHDCNNERYTCIVLRSFFNGIHLPHLFIHLSVVRENIFNGSFSSFGEKYLLHYM
jgi:hypothetical protein